MPMEGCRRIIPPAETLVAIVSTTLPPVPPLARDGPGASPPVN